MESVLIMTRNILSDRELQEKLQYLNYEVLCSSGLFGYLMEHHCYPELLNHFQFIIFSETVSNSEIKYLLPCFEERGNLLFHKVCEELETEEQSDSQEKSIITLSMSSLREQLVRSKFLYKEKKSTGHLETSFSEKIRIPEELEELSLSNLEEKVFYELYHSSGEVITRESLCKSIWGSSVTNSHLSHISAIIKKLRLKLKKMNVSADAIKTVWGEGYLLSPEFFYTEKKTDSIARRLA